MLLLPVLFSVAFAAPQYYYNNGYYYPQQQPKPQQQQQQKVVYVQQPAATANPVPNIIKTIFDGVGVIIDSAGKIKPAVVATTPASSLTLHDSGLDFSSLLQGLFSSQNSQNVGK